MKVTLSNEPLTLDLPEAEFEKLKAAMQAKNPAYEIKVDDHTGYVVNTETGTTLKYEGKGQDKPADDQGEGGKQKMVPDPDPEHDPDRTVAQLKEALDAAQVEYPADARKADLQKLATQHGV